MLKVGDIHAIRRLHYCQGWGIRAISRELGVSRNVVRSVLRGDHDGRYTVASPRKRPAIDRYWPVIWKLLEDDEAEEGWPKQKLNAVAVYRVLVGEHGYTGSEVTVRRAVREVREAMGLPRTEAFVPLEYDPGVDAQVDFFHADAYVSGERRRLTFMLVRACYSRRPFVQRVPAENTEALLETLAAAFAHFGGVFHNLWFDNLTAAVHRVLRSRAREEVQRFTDFRLHHGFEAQFCSPAKGNEKGGVENGGKYVRRSSLVPVPRVRDLSGLDEHCRRWMRKELERRPARSEKTVGDMWSEEAPALIPLRSSPFDVALPRERLVSKFGLIRLATNDYSVPLSLVGYLVTVKCYAERVEIHGRTGLVAQHGRLYGRNQVSFDLMHYLPLLRRKARAFDRAAPVRQARKNWPPAYEMLLRLLRQSLGDQAGTRAFIDVLMLHVVHSSDRVDDAVRQAVTHAEPTLAGVRAYLTSGDGRQRRSETLSAATLTRLPAVKVANGNTRQYDQLCSGERS